MKATTPRHTLTVNHRELSTILAALRLYQQQKEGLGGRCLYIVSDVASDMGTIKPLSMREIDTLCERLNGES